MHKKPVEPSVNIRWPLARLTHSQDFFTLHVCQRGCQGTTVVEFYLHMAHVSAFFSNFYQVWWHMPGGCLSEVANNFIFQIPALIVVMDVKDGWLLTRGYDSNIIGSFGILEEWPLTGGSHMGGRGMYIPGILVPHYCSGIFSPSSPHDQAIFPHLITTGYTWSPGEDQSIIY